MNLERVCKIQDKGGLRVLNSLYERRFINLCSTICGYVIYTSVAAERTEIIKRK